MSKVLLTGNHQMIPVNSPRNSKHQISRLKNKHPLLYAPERICQKAWLPTEGISLFAPLAFGKYDLIHSFNSIIYTNKPWIVTFESILPRTIGYEKLGSIIIHRLLLDNCQKIIAMSHYAKSRFIQINKDFSGLEVLTNKLEVIPPNFPIRASTPKKYNKGETLEVIFVGNHFARKGGIVALRVAEKAKKINLPIKINIVSGMTYGEEVYTDCVNRSAYEQDMQLLNLDNVIYHKKLPNQEVLSLMSKSHFQLMCTLDDTYGFSILEGFSLATPVITTNVCALSEITNENNSFVIDLELNSSKKWIHLENRKKQNYWSILNETYDVLSTKVLEKLVEIFENHQNYEQLSIGAIEQAKIHDPQKANDFFDSLYEEASKVF